jgi:hypothetical protein
MQAVNLDLDLMKKVEMATGGMFGGKPAQAKAPAKTRAEETDALRKMGFKVRRA